MKTLEQYEKIISDCKALFLQKAKDYGTSWTILRLPSATDQIAIKAYRIRSLQEKQSNLVGDSIESEFVGIINYCVIALMLLRLQESGEDYIHNLGLFYDNQVHKAKDVMSAKNHDYGEAWRKMRVESITDLILMKILRIKQIEDNNGETIVSENIDANYIDILNYAVFCLILS